MDKNDILDKAKTIINGERQGTYGNAEDNFASIAAFWSTYLNTPIDSTDVANMMILMKVARNSSGVYKDDNYIDICGYAVLGGEIAAGKELFPREKGKKAHDDAIVALRHGYMLFRNVLKEDDINEE
ncbi:MAG: hypothetical protein BHW15_03840 [Coprococcus sp. CAG:131_42_139]|nr:MAG: hypothetical protein BHW15_03840 [Coprococcus sp. CAG:131_42_139]